MKRIIVIGATGQVGRELDNWREAFPGFRFYAPGRSELDLADPGSIRRTLSQAGEAFCINCAAYTAVDRAESEPEQARLINATGAGRLAEACAEAGIPLIHLSTDYVYHNHLNRPLREDDPTHPRGVYAKTKLEGDRLVLDRHPDSMVIRSSWIYSPFGNNFVKTMLRLGSERPLLRVVYDQIGAPTYARDLARALLDIIALTETGQAPADTWGRIYHYANEGVCSWYDFAMAIFERCGINCLVEAIESIDFPTPAPRPCFSVLNKDRIKDTFGLRIPHWRDSLQDCLERLASADN